MSLPEPEVTLRRWHLRQCPQCTYDFAGLPSKHSCPECGFEFDTEMFVVYGQGTRGPRPGLGYLGIPLVMIAYAAYRFVVDPTQWIMCMLLFAAACGGTIEWWRRYSAARVFGEPEQYLFTAAGAGERSGPGRIDITPWPRIHSVKLRSFPKLQLFYFELRGSFLRTALTGPIIRGQVRCTAAEAEVLFAEIERRVTEHNRAET